MSTDAGKADKELKEKKVVGNISSSPKAAKEEVKKSLPSEPAAAATTAPSATAAAAAAEEEVKDEPPILDNREDRPKLEKLNLDFGGLGERLTSEIKQLVTWEGCKYFAMHRF